MILEIFLQPADKPDGLFDAVNHDDLSAMLAPVIVCCPAGNHDRKGCTGDQVFDERAKLPVHRIGIDDDDALGIALSQGEIGTFAGDITAHVCNAQSLFAKEIVHKEMT